MQVQLIMHPWQVDLNGTIAQPLQLQGVAAEVSLTRLAPDQPSDQHGQAAPSQAPCQLAGHLTQEGRRLGGAGACRDPGDKRSEG